MGVPFLTLVFFFAASAASTLQVYRPAENVQIKEQKTVSSKFWPWIPLLRDPEEANDSVGDEEDDRFVTVLDRVLAKPDIVTGDTTSENVTRIVGGQEANIEDHPYQVSFIVNNSYFCGGFIVSENYILTAAHCAQNVDPTTVVLRAGSTFRKNGTIIPIASVIPHPEYNQPAFDKDVAVMKTVEPIKFSETMQPIDLPKVGRVARGEMVVSGWGRTEQGASSIPNHLMDVQIPVVPWLQCLTVYASVLTKNMLCGGNFFLGGQGTCQGDSGGAAIQDGVAIGIVSFGRGCGQALSPSVFADIAAPTIRNFIKEHSGL